MELNSLNTPQREAVEYTDGPLLVLAGAGSGKTRVLTCRAAYLIDEELVNPWNILCITFTNKAAKEMRNRIDEMAKGRWNAKDMTVSTFHSLCLHILFGHATLLGYGSDFEICDTTDQKAVMKQVCSDLSIDTKKFKERSFLNAISSAKDELKTPEEFAHEAYGEEWYELVAKVYMAYQSALKKANSLDFDDLIMQTVLLFKNNPEVLERYQERFQYIMVDEYQDTNTAQFELIRLLAGKYRNLCVVGDDDQSIYKFRGANIRNILDFEKHYPEAKVVRLEQNYRSTQNILNAANAVIANNVGRKTKTLWTGGAQGDKLSFKQLDNAAEEAMYVAEDIRARVKKGELKYGDCAVLMRTNVQSKELEDAFRVLGIDYDLVKGLRFWDTKVIKDLTSYLLTIASGQNDIRTLRIINTPARGIGAGSQEKLQSFAALNDMSIMEACCDHADETGVAKKSASSIKAFGEMISSLREKAKSMSFAQLLDEVLSDTGYGEYIDTLGDTPERVKELFDYVDKLKEALMVYEESAEEPDLVDFMRQNGIEGNNISSSPQGGVVQRELSEEEERELREKKVLIMTMHNAKGLEFPNVYLVGMEDGLFPGYGSIFSDDPDEIEEERRLCYVAITRAKNRLTLLCAKRRMVNGETRYYKTSRFVREIPLALLDVKLTDEPVRGAAASAAAPTYTGASGGAMARKKTAAVKRRSDNVYNNYAKALKGSQIGSTYPLDYGVGDRVRHVKFGDGVVTDLKNGGRDWEVTVNFDGCGTKRMFAGFAKLLKI